MSQEDNYKLSPEKKDTPSYSTRLIKNYDISFLGTFALLYINGAGLKQFLELVFREIMRKEYNTGPDDLQLFMTFVLIAWDFKILFGIVTDTVKLPFGVSFNKAPRRGYIILLAFT